MSQFLSPGVFVRHPTERDWGLGQVQSVDGHRITVNFENAGKRLINANVITLIEVEPDGDSA
jgi:transcription elongation factor GreA-like protein